MTQKARRPVDADDEHARGHGIQRPGVTDPPSSCETADATHDVMRGDAGRLVHHDDAGSDR
jgi:hypothetical protein